MFFRLPPVGERIVFPTSTATAAQFNDIIQPYRAAFYASGAAALAALLAAAVRRLGVPGAEVILPAYACPELVSATLYAGAHPILVDLARDRPWLDLDRLADAVTSKTAAIVAVDLFGIPERIGEIRARAPHALVIEDSAQFFPHGRGGVGWQADCVVLSFGRGKPVSLLKGGAALCKDPALFADLAPGSPVRARISRARVSAYNILRQPRLYWLPDSLPGLQLGGTRFKPLTAIDAAPSDLGDWLVPNILAYRARAPSVRRKLLEAIPSAPNFIDLARVCGVTAMDPLLRYPVLFADGASRDAAFLRLDRLGLGVSRLYGASLPHISGLEGHFGAAATYPNADSFARRLLTLPTHSNVRAQDIRAIMQALA